MGKTRSNPKGRTTYSIHRVHVLLPLIALAFHPVPIEISEQTVQVVGTRGVSIPLSSVISQEVDVL